MSTIVGPANARAVLDALLPGLKASLDAARGRSADERRNVAAAVQDRLRAFANSTTAGNLADPHEVAAVRDIDTVARDLHRAITADQIEASIAEIESGAARLATLAASLGLQTAANRSAARSISLEPVKKAVDSMTAMVESVKSLKTGLSAADADEASVLRLIDDFAARFDALRKAVKP